MNLLYNNKDSSQKTNYTYIANGFPRKIQSFEESPSLNVSLHRENYSKLRIQLPRTNTN